MILNGTLTQLKGIWQFFIRNDRLFLFISLSFLLKTSYVQFQALTASDRGSEALLKAHLRLEGTGAASGVAGVVDAPGGKRYLLLEGHHGDLHAYVRARRRLREPEARRLFRQAAKAVAKCHENGVVLRDLKLRKFVFADEARYV